jgi:hypothetical protein
MNLWAMAIMVFLLNLPFGYWRANVGRFSWQWFLAIHLPVALAIALRLLWGLGWQFATLSVLAAVFFGGQLSGAKLHAWWGKHARRPVTSCLVMDLLRGLQTGNEGACK